MRYKYRRGGLGDLEQRVLDGEVRAMRALVRQASGPNTLDMAFRDVELRSKPDGTGGERLLFTGYGSVVESPYEMQDWLGSYTEVFRSGAFARTLNASPDTIFEVNHNFDAVPMARTKAGTLRLSEDSTGLSVEADIDGSRSDVYQLQSAMEVGEMDAMSIAFYVTRQQWSPDYDQRDILEVDLDGGDVSVVTFPANPFTTGTTALRKRSAAALLQSGVPMLIAQRAAEERAGAKLSAATLETLQAVLSLISDADEGLASARPMLAELMGVETESSGVEPESAEPLAGLAHRFKRAQEYARKIPA